MRIAFATDEYVGIDGSQGGLANYLKRVALALKKMGHEPIIFISNHETKKDETLYLEGIEVNIVKVKKINKWKRKFTFKTKSILEYRAWSLSEEIKAYHKKKPIDIIQYASCNGVGFHRVKDIPSIIRYSSLIELWFKAYEQSIEEYPYTQEIMFFEEKSFKKVDRVFGPSIVIGKAIEKKLGIKTSLIETPFYLENVVKDYSFYNEALPSKKYLLFFGQLGKLKGIHTIIDILIPVFRKYPDLDFVFVGSKYNSSDYDAISEIMEKTEKHQNRVYYFKPKPHSILYPIIENAHAVVLPSRVDNLPNTALEAMGHKKIVIGTNGASYEQLIEDGKSGFLCEIDNPQSLMSKIDEALALTEEQKFQIGEKAFERVQQLRPEIVVQKLVEFYEDTIKEFHS